MYRPSAFRVDDPARLQALVEAHPFAILVGPGDHVTHLPLLTLAGNGIDTLIGHLAAANPHNEALTPGTEALAIFAGPHGYVSPHWYSTDHAVPTWNYAAVHARLRVRKPDPAQDPRAEMQDMVHRLDGAEDIDDIVTPALIDGMLRGVQRHQFDVLEARGIFKLSQNRSEADVTGVIRALGRSTRGGDRDLAALMAAGLPAPLRQPDALDPRIAEVLDYWFGPMQDGLCDAARRRAMFTASAEQDADIAQRFGALVEAALDGALDHWAVTAPGRLALVTVLDQWPRNIFRGTARAFAGDAAALEFAREGVGRGDDLTLNTEQRALLYMPFEHSEARADQDTAVVLLQRLQAALPEDDPGRPVVENYLHHAREHRQIIARFGRFPHRNAVLQRIDTEFEAAWLADSPRTFGQVPA